MAQGQVEIALSFSEIRGYASDIKALSAEIMGLIDEVKAQVTNIDAVWEGLAHQAFLEQYQTMSAQMKNLPEVVEGLSSMATAYADTMQGVEDTLAK